MSGLFQDIRYGLRMLWKRPGFTAVAVITLALGIGANTTVFNSVNAMLLRPFPFPHLDRIVTIWETVPKQNDQLSPAPANFRDWSEQSTEFSQLAAFRGWDANLTGGNLAEHVEGSQVSADFFPLLGMSAQNWAAILGARISRVGSAPVVVISNGFWQQHLGGDPGLVGRQLLLNGQKFTVIGIASPDFDFPTGSKVWTPLDLNGPANEDRENHSLTVFGRLKDGVSISQAQATLEGIAGSSGRAVSHNQCRPRGQCQEYGGGPHLRFATVSDDADGRSDLCSAAGLCQCGEPAIGPRFRAAKGNRSAGCARGQPLASRTAVAGGERPARPAGERRGVLLSAWGINLLRRSLPPFVVEHVAGLKHFQFDFRVFWFTLMLAIVTGIVAGLAPAWHFSRPNVNDTLKEGIRGGSAGESGRRLRTVLVISEIALSFGPACRRGFNGEGFPYAYDQRHGLRS